MPPTNDHPNWLDPEIVMDIEDAVDQACEEFFHSEGYHVPGFDNDALFRMSDNIFRRIYDVIEAECTATINAYVAGNA